LGLRAPNTDDDAVPRDPLILRPREDGMRGGLNAIAAGGHHFFLYRQAWSAADPRFSGMMQSWPLASPLDERLEVMSFPMMLPCRRLMPREKTLRYQARKPRL